MSYPLGILDYGIGGMGLTKLILEKYPSYPIFYFSDSGYIPYGKLSKAHLRSRVKEVLDFMFEQGCEHITVACHSASTAIRSTDKNVIAITDITVDATLKTGLKNIAIIGGGRTIRSGIYRNHLKEKNIEVRQRIAQELSILIERGEVNGSYLESVLQSILEPIKNADGLLLACTHYPVLSKPIRGFMNENVHLIDPIRDVFEKLIKSGIIHEDQGKSSFVTSGDVRLMAASTFAAFGLEIPEPISVGPGLNKTGSVHL